MNENRRPHYDTYRLTGFQEVLGWVDPEIFGFLESIAWVPWNSSGGVAEIGVYQGRFFLLLRSLLAESEVSLAVDVFEDQSLNVDGSGINASRSVFEANLRIHDPFAGEEVQVRQGDSTDQNFQRQLTEEFSGHFRFVSVDGGHTRFHTVNDLLLAQQLVTNQGIVILDDILNPHWLGVIEGFFSFMSAAPTLVPFAIGNNKLYMCSLSYYDRYSRVASESPSAKKLTSVAGFNVWCVG